MGPRGRKRKTKKKSRVLKFCILTALDKNRIISASKQNLPGNQQSIKQCRKLCTVIAIDGVDD
jgi:hypothetical protein